VRSSASPLPTSRRIAAFERRVASAVAAFPTEVRDSRWVVAASGGPDSTAALVALARSMGPERVVAAHFDHALRSREEAVAERAVVESLAARLGVEFTSGRARGPRTARGTSEAAAREARYRWLASASRRVGADLCATGHTLDDQAETVLLRLARGAGALGAAGMRPLAPWPVPAPRGRLPQLARPLLGVTRAEVEAYVAALDVDTAADPSNATLDYARNQVRHEVMPGLLRVNSRAREHLVAFAEASRADDEALAALAEAWLAEHARGAADGAFELPRAALRDLPEAVAVRVLRSALARLGTETEASHLRAVAGILGRSGAQVDLPGGQARTRGGAIHLVRAPDRAGEFDPGSG
jgi:tRNA(Ile)-lysidine synthase